MLTALCTASRLLGSGSLRWMAIALISLGCLCGAPSRALAGGWQGLVPGVATKDDVERQLGPPSHRREREGKRIWVYSGFEAPEGVKEAQFTLGGGDRVEQIAIIPRTAPELDSIILAYGGECTSEKSTDCYRKLDSGRSGWRLHYRSLGLVAFLSAEGRTVQSMVYVPVGRQAKQSSSGGTASARQAEAKQASATAPAGAATAAGTAAPAGATTPADTAAPAGAATPAAGDAPADGAGGESKGTASEDGSATAAKDPTSDHAPPSGQIYGAVWVDEPPTIDGSPDDAAWKAAPEDKRFFSHLSMPYGQPTTEPTSVRIAYDAKNFYVLFLCRYSSKAPRDASVPMTEMDAVSIVEHVGVVIDGLHDHNNERGFVVTRGGYRADLEVTDSGRAYNFEWRGIWRSAVRSNEDEWIAEFEIPWATAAVPPFEAPGSIGINFTRITPLASEDAAWSPKPANLDGHVPAYLGHLSGLKQVRPGQRLFLAPYLATAVREAGSVSRMRDFRGAQDPVVGFAGIYGRLQPFGPLQLDFTVNPDFSSASPDQALARLNRFEVFFPETREFFSQDRARFEFGTDRFQLFYSRRIGLRETEEGIAFEPILYGAKGLVKLQSTAIGVLSVGSAAPGDALQLGEITNVFRANQFFGASRVGAIVLNRGTRQEPADYWAYGVDGVLSLVEDHLALSGFAAHSTSLTTPGGFSSNAAIDWTSQEYVAKASWLQVENTFDPRLGYYELTGIRELSTSAGFRPQIHNDLIQSLSLDGNLTRTLAITDQLSLERRTLSASGTLLSQATVGVSFTQNRDRIEEPFALAGERLVVDPGDFRGMVTKFSLSSPPGRDWLLGFEYQEGDFFSGYQRIPAVQFGLRLWRLMGATTFELYQLRLGEQEVVGQRLSESLTLAYSPYARSTLILELNTLESRVAAQFISAWTFGTLSTVSMVVSNGSDSFAGLSRGNFLAQLTFTYGFSPF